MTHTWVIREWRLWNVLPASRWCLGKSPVIGTPDFGLSGFDKDMCRGGRGQCGSRIRNAHLHDGGHWQSVGIDHPLTVFLLAKGRRQLAERDPHLTETDVGLDQSELVETIDLQPGEWGLSHHIIASWPECSPGQILWGSESHCSSVQESQE